MSQPQLNNNQLNQQQQDMLRLFKNPMPDEDYIQMRRLAVQLLAKQLEGKVESWEEEKSITPEYYEQLSQKHLRKSDPKH